MKDGQSLPDSRYRALWLLLLLVAAWLLWSGIYKPLIIGLGAFSCAVTINIVRRMDILDKNLLSVHFNFRFFGYWLWLIKEIIKSSLIVSKLVLNPRLPISPHVFDIDASALDAADQGLLGNSITLTPGTLTMDLYEGVIKVHSLTKEGADDLMEGEMTRRVLALRKVN